MITKEEMQLVLERSVEKGAEFAELFFEDRNDQEIQYGNRSVQAVKHVSISGAGLRFIQGTKEIYTYTNDLSLSGLIALADQAAELLEYSAHTDLPEIRLDNRQYVNPNPVQFEPEKARISDKILVAKEADAAILGAGVPLLAHHTIYRDMDQTVWIANSEGLYTTDRRVTGRVRAYYTVGDETGGLYEWADYNQPMGMEAWQTDAYQKMIREQVQSSYRSFKAKPIQTCRLPVVLEAGVCGTLWHECCGHTLEASAIARGSSDFIGKIGQKVASSKVTLLDDGTLPGFYGSSAVDDEGHPRQRNVLIENGVLKSYLCDRLHGRQIGMESNGCGRRQDYTFAPTSRMSNTYLAAGQDDDEEMIRSLGEGLYVKRLGGGSGGQIFSLVCAEAYLIKNGKIDRPVKNCMLTGNGLEVMKKVDRVGRQMGYDYGSFCGADSGLVNVTTFQPRVRISEMVIGGED